MLEMEKVMPKEDFCLDSTTFFDGESSEFEDSRVEFFEVVKIHVWRYEILNSPQDFHREEFLSLSPLSMLLLPLCSKTPSCPKQNSKKQKRKKRNRQKKFKMISSRRPKKGGNTTSISLMERLSMLLLVSFSFMMGSMVTTYALVFIFRTSPDDDSTSDKSHLHTH